MNSIASTPQTTMTKAFWSSTARSPRAVADVDQRSLRAIGDSAGRIGEHGVRHERLAALAQREEHRERDGLVAVPELAQE
jgi:hypothetical protein